MINKDFFVALDELEKQKGIKKEFFIEALETALVSAYKRNFGEAKAISVKLSPEKNTIKLIAYKTIVDEVTNEDTEISLKDAKEIKKSYKIGDIIQEEFIAKDFGRIAAGTAKQVITQKLREAERGKSFNELEEKLDTLLVGLVRRVEADTIYVELGTSQIEGILMQNDQIPGEKYQVNDRIKVYLKKLKETPKGFQAILSRSCPGFVKRLFINEVPEIASGEVEIKSIVREAGFRTKMALYSANPNIDPVGACVGNRGLIINGIVDEIGGEKIDIIEWSSDALEFIAKALQPAPVIRVEVDDETKMALAIVPDNKLSLAIGKSGQNVRLAVKLTGWKIDVKPESKSAMLTKPMKPEEQIPVEIDLDMQGIDDLFEDVAPQE